MRSRPRLSLQTINVLIAFLEEPAHEYYGLELAKRTKLTSGTLYPILARLEKHGWLESDWEEIDPSAEGRRPRRYYRLTAEGVREARAAIKEAIPLVPQFLGGAG